MNYFKKKRCEEMLYIKVKKNYKLKLFFSFDAINQN